MKWALLSLAVLSSSVWAQTTITTIAIPFDKTVEVTPSQNWTDSAIDLHPGDVVEIAATPSDTTEKACEPQGTAANGSQPRLPLPSALPGALIAKLQEQAETLVFVGAQRRLKIAEQGRLYFGTNVTGPISCAGKFSVKIHVIPGDPATGSVRSKLGNAAQVFLGGQFGTGATQNAGMASDAAPGSVPAAGVAPAEKTLPVSRAPLDDALSRVLQSLPRRVNDEFQNLGDMVNFVLVGSEKQVQDALAAANWHVADASAQGAVAKAILMATQKQDYLQMPMSPLYLFDRVQDFGYEQAEPYAMVASRHHFRIWKSSLTFNGLPVWAGAGTHDIGFEKDQRNGKVTHKIDPKVDGERDHIAESLLDAGQVRTMTYFMPSDPVQDARNATGGGYQSDGRVLVIFLQ